MPAPAWVTLAAAALVVLFAALALLRVIINLRHVSFTLGTITTVVHSIAEQTEPVPGVIASVNANLQPVRAGAEKLGR